MGGPGAVNQTSTPIPSKMAFPVAVRCCCRTPHPREKGTSRNEFIAKCGNRISGTLAGFDRLVFRGNLALNHESGMKGYLWANQVPWKDYAAHVTQISAQVKQAALAPLEARQRPIRYLSSGKDSKEQLARSIARQDGITQGSICAFTAVEPCITWRVCGDRSSQRLPLQRCGRQCLFVYHYWM